MLRSDKANQVRIAAEAALEGDLSAKSSVKDQDNLKVLQQKVHDRTEQRGDTSTDGVSNSEKEKRKSSAYHRSMRLQGCDSLAGTASKSFWMSFNRARKNAVSQSSTIRGKNRKDAASSKQRKGVSSAGIDAGSSRVRLRGGDSLAGIASKSFQMSGSKARKDEVSLSSSVRSKNRKDDYT